ncbi:P-loop containing nucleoside triphosphate hydrolase protein [Sporormia fimetaria CBS 119925]|uniref:P-loop containing nucleoside triphosphate hydrolase protein n=1 Tax=Sporormia fimetaria CBS 119925 TaxID=1340428 RepID=A0A6A6VDG1_9PLEO|nr:P-loop containing nucleoside triphosphate hydrolase protein [Sporormia fimetaria CBS 119925]
MAHNDSQVEVPSSSHRMRTLPAINAMQGFHACVSRTVSTGSRTVSTGIARLDELLAPQSLPDRHLHGGLVRGKVTEVYGPSGAGKTAFGIQVAASALREGQSVVWIDAGAPLLYQRLVDVLSGSDAVAPPDAMQERFHRFATPTLAHLLALFLHSPASFPRPNTSLIIIDSLSTLIDDAYPKSVEPWGVRKKSDDAKWAAKRKIAVIDELISALARVASMHDIALLIACQTITRMRDGARALLVPAISSAAWEKSISTRLVFFRDWAPAQSKCIDVEEHRLRKTRFVGVVKRDGVTLPDESGVGDVVPFAIENVSQSTTRRAYIIVDA